MRFKINYEIWEYEDSFIIEWDTIEEIREIASAEEARRWLTIENNNLWAERLD
jgi:hypothetical protein